MLQTLKPPHNSMDPHVAVFNFTLLYSIELQIIEIPMLEQESSDR